MRKRTFLTFGPNTGLSRGNRAMYGVDDVKGVLNGKKDGEAPAIVASWRETLKRLAK